MDKITRGEIIDLIASYGRENVVFSLSSETKNCTVTLIKDNTTYPFLYEVKKEGEIDDLIMGEFEITPKVKVVKKVAKTVTIDKHTVGAKK